MLQANAVSSSPKHLTPTPHSARQLRRVSGASGASGVTGVVGVPRDRTASAVELAHDLRSPMVALLVITEALARGRFGPVTDSQRHYLCLVHEAVQGLAQVITDTVERAELRPLDREDVQFSPSSVLDEVRRILQPQADAAGIALVVEGGPPGEVRRHRHALLRVLLNLASNAIKFTADGQVTLSAQEAGPGRLQFRVRDTGPGCCALATDALSAPLRPDERGNGVSTGLGLPMCQRLLASIGSALVFEPSPTGGSDFSFTVEL